MRSAREAWRRRGRLLGLLAVGLALGLPASAARLVAVRVGHHPDFTRVVIQLDERASYRIEGPHAAPPPELRLTVAAGSDPLRLVPPRWTRFVRGVRVEPAAGATRVRVLLDRAELRVAEQVLERPPRIVLDVAPAAAPVPPPREPAISPEPKPPAPEPEAAPPAPEPAAEAAPALPPTEAPAPPPTEAVAPEPPSPGPQAAPGPPPVTAAPPAREAWRMLLLVLGAIALLAGVWIALSRRTRARAAEAATPPPAVEPAPAPAVEAVPPPAVEPAPPRPRALPPSPAAPAAPAEPETILAALRAIERRLAGIEARLDDVLDWRERSARTLEAQAEELRVQRAALSRVRRVVRSMARPEDLLGEPRLR